MHTLLDLTDYFYDQRGFDFKVKTTNRQETFATIRKLIDARQSEMIYFRKVFNHVAHFLSFIASNEQANLFNGIKLYLLHIFVFF